MRRQRQRETQSRERLGVKCIELGRMLEQRNARRYARAAKIERTLAEHVKPIWFAEWRRATRGRGGNARRPRAAAKRIANRFRNHLANRAKIVETSIVLVRPQHRTVICANEPCKNGESSCVLAKRSHHEILRAERLAGD